MKSRRDRIRDHYEPRIKPNRRNYAVLDWASQASQQARFKVLADQIDLTGKTLLDVGSGLGDLWAYLKQRGVAVDYTGVDLIGKMVRRAGELHPDARFLCADIFADETFAPRSFDVVYCSGMFNLKLGNNDQFLRQAVYRFLEVAREHVVFNLLHRRAAWPFFGKYCYYKPDRVVKMLSPSGWRAHVIDNYLFNDFTVVCVSPDAP